METKKRQTEMTDKEREALNFLLRNANNLENISKYSPVDIALKAYELIEKALPEIAMHITDGIENEELRKLLFMPGKTVRMNGEQYNKYVVPYLADFLYNRGELNGSGISGELVSRIERRFNEGAFGQLVIGVADKKDSQLAYAGQKGVDYDAELFDGKLFITSVGHHRKTALLSPALKDKYFNVCFICMDDFLPVYDDEGTTKKRDAKEVLTMAVTSLGKQTMDIANKAGINDCNLANLRRRLDVVAGLIFMLLHPEKVKKTVPSFGDVTANKYAHEYLTANYDRGSRTKRYEKLYNRMKKFDFPFHALYAARNKCLKEYPKRETDTLKIDAIIKNKIIWAIKDWYGLVKEFQKSEFMEEKLKAGQWNEESGCPVFDRTPFFAIYVYETLFGDDFFHSIERDELLKRMEECWDELNGTAGPIRRKNINDSHHIDNTRGLGLYLRFMYHLTMNYKLK